MGHFKLSSKIVPFTVTKFSFRDATLIPDIPRVKKSQVFQIYSFDTKQ